MPRFSLRTLLIVLALVATIVVVALYLVVNSGASFETVVEAADEINVYEGLPHQGYESRLFEHERQTKAVHQFENYWFYRQPVGLKPEDGKTLVEAVMNPQTLKPFTGEKKCGGFHPDYAIEFRKGLSRYQVLICFGCHEAKVIGPQGKSRHNLGSGGYEAFAEILKPYQTNRPAQKLDDEFEIR
jgi:hypothetical protein